MKKAIIEAMEAFVIRVAKGGNEVHPQETAVLPEILRTLKEMPEDNQPADINPDP